MGSGKKKIEIKRIEKESRRMVTFSKRRKGLFRKADELRAKTGAKVGILVMSASGKPYPYGDLNVVLKACSSSNSDLKEPHNDWISTDDEESEESSGSGICSRTGGGSVISSDDDDGSKASLKRWLDEFNVDNCKHLGELLWSKKQLEAVKEVMMKTEVESWRLS